MSGIASLDARSDVDRFFPYAILVVGLLLIFSVRFLIPHYQNLATEIVILGLFALAFNVLYGYTGLLSFGHGMFFGLGAYAGARLINTYPDMPFVAVVLVVAAITVAFCIPVGVVSLRLSGVYFAIVTLAIAQLMYLTVLRMDSVGGESGLPLDIRPSTYLPLDLVEPYQFFVLVGLTFLASYLFIRTVVRSPMGDVFQGIRENEERVRHLGYNVFYFKLVAFTISGTFAAIAGLLFVLYLYFASPTFLYWTQSGDAVIMTLLGGANSLVGPLLGAGFLVMLEEFLSPRFDQWYMFVGAVVIVVVLYLPDGILGKAASLYARIRSKLRES